MCTCRSIDDMAEMLAAAPPARTTDHLDAARLLAGLKGRKREIVASIPIEGSSVRQVAERFDMSEGAVRVAYHRGLRAMERWSATRRQDRPLAIGSPLGGLTGFGRVDCREAKEGCHQHARGTGSRDEVARHLGNAAGALSLAHRNLEDPQPGRRDPHLHLEVPAKCLLLHTEAVEHITADRAEG